jgi:exosortase E/protease (VPEID-CTERM system)
MNRNLRNSPHACLPEHSNAKEVYRFAKWGFALLLLFGEIAGIQWRYSIGAIEGNDALWAKLVCYAAYLLWDISVWAPPAIVAALVIGGKQFWEDLIGNGKECRDWAEIWRYFCGHLLTFAVFAWLTGRIIEGGAHPSRYPTALVVLWILVGVAAVFSWCLILYSLKVWIKLLWDCRRGLAGGIFVGIAVWLSSFGISRLWPSLAKYTFQSVQWLLIPIIPDFHSDPATLTIGSAQFTGIIAVSCSGLQGIALIAIILAAYLFYSRDDLRFPQAFLLFPIGILAIWFANSLRIAALIMIGTCISAEVASGGFHSQAGWVALNAVALGLIAVAGRMRFFTKVPSSNKEPIKSDPAVAYLAPLLATLAAAMVTGMFSAGFDLLYPLRVIIALGVLWYFRKSYKKARLAWSWIAILIGVGTSAMWLILARLSPNAQTGIPEGIAGLSTSWAIIWIIFKVVGYVGTTPVVEELAFRGYLLRRLVSTEFTDVQVSRITMFAVVLSSVLFGAMHGRNWLPGILAGMLYAWAYHRRGQIGNAMLAHATTNALIALYVLISGDWSKWS